jgi:hypothetical protein
MFASKVFTLGTKKNTNFIYNFKDSSYIIGFNNKSLALKCNSIITPLTLIDINIKSKLRNDNNIVNMKIHKIIDFHEYKYKINEIDLVTFLTYPIINNIGIIIGMEVISNEPDCIIIESLLIDSFNNPKYFIASV